MRCSLKTWKPPKKNTKPSKFKISAIDMVMLNLTKAGCDIESAAETVKAMTEVPPVSVMAVAPSLSARAIASSMGKAAPAAFIAVQKMKVQSTPTAVTRNTAKVLRMVIGCIPM
jgi:hypothetical protein